VIGRTIDNSYYLSHMPVIENRIEKAGIRLAGVLNELLKNGMASSATTTRVVTSDKDYYATIPVIEISDAAKHTGESVTITAKAYSSRDMGSFILVNLGAAYPNQLLTIVLRGNSKDKGQEIDGKTVTVTGKVIDYKGKPEIEVNDPLQVQVK
jgi:hypothetical protein